MFSLLAPHTKIPAHVLKSTTAASSATCRWWSRKVAGFWVGAETSLLEKGQAFVFDDTRFRSTEALNPSSELRIVFIFDVWHPELSPLEREAIKAPHRMRRAFLERKYSWT